MSASQITYRPTAFITAPEIDTDFLWGLSFFFMGLAALYFVSVFLFRNRINSKSARTKRRKTELSPMVSEFLFYEEDANKSEKSKYIELKIAIRELLRDDFNRTILSEILIDLRKDVSGDTKKRLFKLYQDLGLEKDAFLKLKSWRWEVISKGILELTLMQVEDAYGFIVNYINDRRTTIRKQAEIATVTLRPDGIDYFLDTTKYKISEWQQLKLLEVLRNKEGFEPPRFKAWLTSTNKHVVLFTLRLIKYYRQNDANASLVELIKHKDVQVRRQAIACIEEFNVTEALPVLKGVFKKCNVDIKIAILGAIGELGSIRDIEFLKATSQREGNFSVKSKAVGAINTISPEQIMPTEGIEYVKEYERPEELHASDCKSNAVSEPRTEELQNHASKKHEATTSSIEDNPNLDQLETFPPLPTENQIPMAQRELPDATLRNIEVIFDEICPETPTENRTDALSQFDEAALQFIPIVVADEIKDQVAAIEVHSVEDVSETMDEELQDMVAEIKEITFLPFVIDEEAEETLEFSLEEEPIVEVENPEVEDVLSWLMADNEMRNIECQYETLSYSSDESTREEFIPEPVYYDEHEAYMMGLLDDLEELGDHREIELLEELKAEESKSFIKDRINLMIQKFELQRETKKSEKVEPKGEAVVLPVFSVFADLFKSIDTESKLILLDEIVAVGDEKEIEFLDHLLENPNQQIRDKAQVVLKELIAKLSRENPSATYSKGVSNIVAEQIKNDEKLSEEIYDSLLSELGLNSSEKQSEYEGNNQNSLDLDTQTTTSENDMIFDIDFEISEILDKKCAPEILNLPVVSTEVLPNTGGDSFFAQMRNITKLFF